MIRNIICLVALFSTVIQAEQVDSSHWEKDFSTLASKVSDVDQYLETLSKVLEIIRSNKDVHHRTYLKGLYYYCNHKERAPNLPKKTAEMMRYLEKYYFFDVENKDISNNMIVFPTRLKKAVNEMDELAIELRHHFSSLQSKSDPDYNLTMAFTEAYMAYRDEIKDIKGEAFLYLRELIKFYSLEENRKLLTNEAKHRINFMRKHRIIDEDL